MTLRIDWASPAMRFALAAVLALPVAGQSPGLWLAGRYDATHVIVYFDETHFGDLYPKSAHNLPEPEADGFFSPIQLPAGLLPKLQLTKGSEHFALGGEYEILLSSGEEGMVRLTTLIGTETDEGVGNPSYLGALAQIESLSLGPGLPATPRLGQADGDYFVLRHRLTGATGQRPQPATIHGGDDPVPFEIEAAAAKMLEAERRAAGETISAQAKLELTVQSFHLATGTQRYFARGQWKNPPNAPQAQPPVAMGLWLASGGAAGLRMVGREPPSNSYGILPRLLSAVNLEDGRTLVIWAYSGDDGGGITLSVYKDGKLSAMREIQSIGMGE